MSAITGKRHWANSANWCRSEALKRRYSSVKQLDFLPRIESLRGIAALVVVGYHVNGQLSALPAHGWFDGFASRLITAFSNGIGAVVTFFVLSGFVLARSLDADSDPVRFFRNRLFRLFPAAMTVVALLTLLYWQFGLFVGYKASFDPLNIVLNLLLIRSDINGVMWSMTVECVATPLILVSVWLFRRYGEAVLWGLVAFLFGLSFWGSYVHLLGGFTNLAPFYAFVVGVLIHFQGVRPTTLVSSRLVNATAIAAIAIFSFGGASKQTALILALECLSAAILIMLIAWRQDMILFKPLDFQVGAILRPDFLQLLFAAPTGYAVCFSRRRSANISCVGDASILDDAFRHAYCDPVYDSGRLFDLAVYRDAVHQPGKNVW